MYILWKLVFLAVVSTGPSSGSDLENISDLNKEKSNHRRFLSKHDIISQSKFQCQNKPSGYYADPQYDCKVFYYCQEDGSKITIPCILDTEKHKICVFKDVVSNACENSEIYLALPEDLQIKNAKETTASTINNTTDFKLSSVLPVPLSPENNHSTTPLSLDFDRNGKPSSLFNTKETDSIFEVINSVLREIRTEGDEKISVDSKALKLSPASFRRGSRFQASSIRRDDSEDSIQKKDNSKDGDTFLVEVYQKRNGKLTDENNHYYKKSKKLFFLPKLENKSPATHPRRKKRTVVEPLSVSRPYAVIYAKVPNVARSESPRAEKKSSNQRLDILEVPFAPARVPADVPTVPITIETRRKKKSKSKKKPKNISHAIFFPENVLQETGNEQASEQQNVLFFAPEDTPSVSLQNTRDRTSPNNRQRLRQNAEQSQQITAPLNSNSESPQNNRQLNYQTSLSDQGTIPLQIPNFSVQPASFLADSDVPHYYFPSEDILNSENFPSFNLQDQFVNQQQPRVPQHNSYIIPNNAPPQSVRPAQTESQTRQQDNNVPQSIRHTQNHQHQNIPQQENLSYQRNRNPNNNPQSIRQQDNAQQVIRPQNRPQNIRQPERAPPQYYSQPEYSPQAFRQQQNNPQSYRQSGNVRPTTISQPETILIQTVREPENVQVQTLRQPENVHSQTIRQPENILEPRPPENTQPQAFQYTLGQPQTVGQPGFIQPQSLGQLENLYLQNLPTFPFVHDGLQQTVRQQQPEEPKLTQNANILQNSPTDNEDKKKNERERKPPQNLHTFSGFDSPFFQQFSSFGSPNFQNSFGQPAPQPFDILSPNTIRYQEQTVPSQNTNPEEKSRGQVPQPVEKPQDQNIRHLISERPQNFIPQQYGNQNRQQIHNNRNPTNNYPGSSVISQQQPNLNPNLVDSERVIQERPSPNHENIRPQTYVSVPEISRPPRNRGRTTVPIASTTRPPTRQRSRAHQTPTAERYNAGRPQENTRLPQRYQESPQYSNTNRRPTQSPRTTSEVVYHSHYEPETAGGQITNDVYNRPPTTVTVSDHRSRQTPKPYNTRDDQRDINHSQRQRDRHYDSSNRQTHPQYSTYHQSPTTPLPSYTPRERSRRPEAYQNRGAYQQNSRQINKESSKATEADKPYYRPKTTPSSYSRSRARVSTAREQPTEKLPVTSMYFVTSTPRVRTTEEASYSRRPHRYSETQHEKQRSRPQAQIEGPPNDYVKADPIREEIPIPHRYYSNQPPNPNYENDVNIISTAEDPDVRQRSTPGGSGRRPGYRGTSLNERPRYNPDIEHGFLPVSEKPPRERIYTTRDAENEYYQTPKTYDREYPYATSAPAREYVTRVPEKEYLYTTQAPERNYPYVPRNTERELPYTTIAPEREHSRYYPAPEKEHSRYSPAPEKEHSRYSPAPEKEHSRYSPAPEREHSRYTPAPEREHSRYTPAKEKEHSRYSPAPEREHSRYTPAPEREHSRYIPAPEREHSRYSPDSDEPSYAPRAPNRHRERINTNTHENRYHDHYEEIPTTQPTTTTTTTKRPTKKPRPPPPRPTFPPFPTFPPPPKRLTTPPRPQTEAPKYENRQPETTEHVTEGSVTTEEAKRYHEEEIEYKSDISEPRYVTENYIQTSTPEVTTRRRSRKRRPRPRLPKTTTPYTDDEDPIQVESVTQATTRKEITTRSTPSNYNRWRQQTSATKRTTTTTPPSTKSTTENSDKAEEYGSRINLFGRPRTRKPVFNPRPQTTTPASSDSSDRRRVTTKSPMSSRTRKPFVKKVKKKVSTTTEAPDATESIARSDENSDSLHYNSDINLQELESATQLLVENMDDYGTTEAYKDALDTITEMSTISYQDEELVDYKDNSETGEGTRSLSQKFQNRSRILKFGKPRLKAADTPLDLNEKEST